MTNPETSSDLVERLRYRVNNPSAWEAFEQPGSDLCDEAATTIERLTADLEDERLHNAELFSRALAAESLAARQAEALKPFAGDKMPNLRRTLIDYDRYGLRRIISPMEIAMIRARAALTKGPSNG